MKVEGRQLHYPQRGQVGEKAFFEEDSEFDVLIFGCSNLGMGQKADWCLVYTRIPG